MRLERTVQSPSLSFPEATSLFLLHQKSCRHSKHTILHYESSLKKLAAFLEEGSITFTHEIKPTHLRLFIGSLQDSYRPKTAHGIASDVRALFKFLEAEELIESNPMRTVKLPKLDKTILPAFTPDEVTRLLKACSGRDSYSVRNRAILLVLLDSGIRLKELSAMKVGDVDLSTGTFKIMGKGAKERICYLGAAARKEFFKYARIRRGETGEPLWIGKYGEMTYFGLAEVVERIGNAANVHAHAHKFRRTCALTMLRNGCDVFSLQHVLGHSDLSILRRYLAQTERDCSVAHERFSAVNAMTTRSKQLIRQSA